MEFPAELYQILKDDVVKALNMPKQIWTNVSRDRKYVAYSIQERWSTKTVQTTKHLVMFGTKCFYANGF